MLEGLVLTRIEAGAGLANKEASTLEVRQFMCPCLAVGAIEEWHRTGVATRAATFHKLSAKGTPAIQLCLAERWVF